MKKTFNENSESEPIIEKNEVIKETDFYEEMKKYPDTKIKINILSITIIAIAIIIALAIIFN
jgi:hypothetical protein